MNLSQLPPYLMFWRITLPFALAGSSLRILGSVGYVVLQGVSYTAQHSNCLTEWLESSRRARVIRVGRPESSTLHNPQKRCWRSGCPAPIDKYRPFRVAKNIAKDCCPADAIIKIDGSYTLGVRDARPHIQIMEVIVSNDISPDRPVMAKVYRSRIRRLGANTMDFIQLHEVFIAVNLNCTMRSSVDQVVRNSVPDTIHANPSAVGAIQAAKIVDAVTDDKVRSR
jgi:hypothetical protein